MFFHIKKATHIFSFNIELSFVFYCVHNMQVFIYACMQLYTIFKIFIYPININDDIFM